MALLYTPPCRRGSSSWHEQECHMGFSAAFERGTRIGILSTLLALSASMPRATGRC
jgi:hypothetical protein